MKRILIILLLFPFCTKSQIITTFAGDGVCSTSGDSGPATAAHISNAGCGNFDLLGNYYFAQSLSNPRVCMVNSSGIIYTVAGNGVSGYSGDGGLATSAEFSYPSIFVDPSGDIFIADRFNQRVRKVTASTGIINTIAGLGYSGALGDGGPATAASISPFGLCKDIIGNLYIIDSGVRIRMIDTSGIITTIAGTGVGGFSGDGGPVTAANLTINDNICLDASSSNLYIDCSSRIRKINLSSGVITTIAGNGVLAYSGDEIPATSAHIGSFGIYVDEIGNLFIADPTNERIRKVDTFGIIHTIAGTGVGGFSGDGGPATAAEIYIPEGVVTDACGSLYIAEDANCRIRKVTFNPDCWLASVQNITSNNTINIYPNPATTELTISSSNLITSIAITNILGQTVYTHEYNSQQVQVDVADLPKGMYLVRINGSEVRKFVKE